MESGVSQPRSLTPGAARAQAAQPSASAPAAHPRAKRPAGGAAGEAVGPALLIRPCRAVERDTIVALWRACALTRPWNDPYRDLDRKLADSPWGMLVGELDGRVVATVMVGYDGHRGSVNYLAVESGLRGQGVGTALMDHAEALLLDRECPKINLSVRADNADAGRFYTARGYRIEGADHAVTFVRRLIADGPVA